MKIAPIVIDTIDNLISTNITDEVNNVATTAALKNTVENLLQKLAYTVSDATSNKTVKVNAKNIAILVTKVNVNEDTVIRSTFAEKIDIETLSNEAAVLEEDISLVVLPKSAFFPNDTISCILYRTSVLFPVENSNLKVGSVIQGITIGNRAIENLDPPIKLDFKNTNSNLTDMTRACKYWQEGKIISL